MSNERITKDEAGSTTEANGAAKGVGKEVLDEVSTESSNEASSETKDLAGKMNSQFFRVLAWNVMQMRQGCRLTQDELAEKTGLSRYQISRTECGFGDQSELLILWCQSDL